MNLSRRKLLKAGLASTAALLGGGNLHRAFAQDDDYDPGGRVRVDYDETASFNEQFGNPPLLGRVEGHTLRVTPDPSEYYEAVRTVHYSHVVPIMGITYHETPAPYQHNDVWYVLPDGYIHSSYVVPVREKFNEPEDVPADGFWGEITVPTSWQHWRPALRSLRYFDLAYGSVYKVIDRAEDDDDPSRLWYQLLDDANPTHAWWVQASHVRRIEKSEFSAINKDADPIDKRIEVSIEHQRLICYEGEQPVFASRIASGTSFIDAEGEVHHFNTPYGEHYVQRKTPSRHMAGGEDINDTFDLPGVPWCVFFTPSGAAIHGTYWHNDYGRPRSHGCVNVTPAAAKWIYRWVSPYAGYDDDYYWTDKDERENATRIIVT